MFVTKSQFYVFIACVALGAACGILFSLSSAIKKIVKFYPLKVFSDFAAFFLTTCAFVFFAYSSGFPDFRFYMCVSVLLGISGYMKSFDIIVAKSGKKAYNLLRKVKFKKKRERRVVSDDGIKN